MHGPPLRSQTGIGLWPIGTKTAHIKMGHYVPTLTGRYGTIKVPGGHYPHFIKS